MTELGHRTEVLLERLAGMVGERAGIVQSTDLRGSAHRRARAAFENLGRDSCAQRVALLGFVADLLASAAYELTRDPSELGLLIHEIDAVAGVPRQALGREVLRGLQLLELPVAAAIDVDLALLVAFMRADAVSLWITGAEGALTQVASAGDRTFDDDGTRSLARRLLTAESSSPPSPRSVDGVVIGIAEGPAAALIAAGGSSVDRVFLLEAAGPVLGLMLDRWKQISHETGPDPKQSGATERRLARLRFDLHDGPQQDIVLLGEDLRHFRTQLAGTLDDGVTKDRLLGRVDDLEARMVALDADLRRMSGLLQSPFLQSDSLVDALNRLTDEFAARSGIEPEVSVRGDASTLTESQQIALLALIREALANVRDHSEATHVAITLSADSRGIEATVTDDGHGFDPETALVEAVREGHLGLVGMHERMRMLGGRTEIHSRPGGPTVISVRLPPFEREGQK